MLSKTTVVLQASETRFLVFAREVTCILHHILYWEAVFTALITTRVSLVDRQSCVLWKGRFLP